jgi:hypothetical protein
MDRAFLGDQLLWSKYIPRAWRIVGGAHTQERFPSSMPYRDEQVWPRRAHATFSALLDLLYFRLGWVSPGRGLLRWHEEGRKPSDPVLNLMGKLRGDGLDWFICWAAEFEDLPAPRELRAQLPHFSDRDELHLSGHCHRSGYLRSHRATPVASRRERGVLLLDDYDGWWNAVAATPSEYFDPSINVVVKSIGWMGAYRLSPTTGIPHATSEEVHLWGWDEDLAAQLKGMFIDFVEDDEVVTDVSSLPQIGNQVIVYIPNDDTAVSALHLRVSVDGHVLEDSLRIDGDWHRVNWDEQEGIWRGSMAYVIKPFALETLLRLQDAGTEIDACLVEAAMKEPETDIWARSLWFTREHLSEFLKARGRREPEPSALTTWLREFLDGERSCTAKELLERLLDLHEDARNQGPPLQRFLPDLPPGTEVNLDWDALGQEGPSEELGWQRLTQFVAALVALTDDVVVISVDTGQFDSDVYVQLCREDDGALTLEAVSDAFLDPPLPPDTVDVLHQMGWEDPPGEGLPNFVQYLESDRTAPGEVAGILVETLRRAYSVKPSDSFRFAPLSHVRALLNGDFGAELAANPDLSPGRRARLPFGVTFPGDVGPSLDPPDASPSPEIDSS